jgi:hypothetical protein
MSPRKRTVDDLDDVDDEDDAVEEEMAQETDLDVTIHDEQDTGLGGLQRIEEEER